MNNSQVKECFGLFFPIRTESPKRHASLMAMAEEALVSAEEAIAQVLVCRLELSMNLQEPKRIVTAIDK